MAEDDIVADFALTGLATDGLRADWRAAHPDRTLSWPGYGHAPAEVMRFFLADLAASHGSVRDYTRTELGVDDELVAALRAHILDEQRAPAPARVPR